jgi:hypothetical protein
MYKLEKTKLSGKYNKQKILYLGNIYSKRDWGHAKDYVLGMWKILQYKKPDDFVLSTGNAFTVKYFINKVAKKSLDLIGDACWHCHIGASTFPIQTAVKWKIPLMIYGESIAEKDGRGSYKNILKPEEKYYYGLDISAKVQPDKYVDNDIKYSEMQVWNYPSRQDMVKSNVIYLHLGDYIFWDEQKQTEFIINQFSWKINDRVENTYKGYKSNECIMAGVHDYLNFMKRGVGRATLHASDDVRRGLIKRDEAISLIKKYDPQRPHALDYFLKITDLKEKNLENKIIASRKFSKFASKLNKFK